MNLAKLIFTTLPALLISLSATTIVLPQKRVDVRRAAVGNPTIRNIVREIDARNVERSIRQLASFGTRNTLSEQNNPQRGIGAARDWLYAEFLRIAETSG